MYKHVSNNLYFTVVGGFAPERIVQELTWERVANVNGGVGKNIGLDLLNEFLNNDFKGTGCKVIPLYFETQKIA